MVAPINAAVKKGTTPKRMKFFSREFMRSPYRKGWLGVLKALLVGDRRNTLCHKFSIRQALFSAYYRHSRWPLAYALWRELRSLPFRILATHETLGDHVGADLGERFQKYGGRLSNVGTRCRKFGHTKSTVSVPLGDTIGSRVISSRTCCGRVLSSWQFMHGTTY